MKESCEELTAPQLVSVVTVAKSADCEMPKRTSLPSMLPPELISVVFWSTPCSSG